MGLPYPAGAPRMMMHTAAPPDGNRWEPMGLIVHRDRTVAGPGPRPRVLRQAPAKDAAGPGPPRAGRGAVLATASDPRDCLRSCWLPRLPAAAAGCPACCCCCCPALLLIKCIAVLIRTTGRTSLKSRLLRARRRRGRRRGREGRRRGSRGITPGSGLMAWCRWPSCDAVGGGRGFRS